MAHPFVSGAINMYSDFAVGQSPTMNASVWVTSDDKQIENILDKFINDMHINERIYDWAGTLGMYGDLFVEAIGNETVGIAYLDDSIHPMDMERIEINGRLEGFVRTGYMGTNVMGAQAKIEAPWDYSHFRIFGVDKRVQNTTLGVFGEPGRRYALGSMYNPALYDRKMRITSRYGTSLLSSAIEPYKRLKMAEDSLLMSRMTRGIIWYLYKVKVTGGSFDNAAEIVQEYAELVKRSTALNTKENEREWKDKFLPMLGAVEDLVIPESDDMTVEHEQMGSLTADIKAIVDVENMENRLLAALRISRVMLGLTDQLPGSIGQTSADRLSINFAKSVARLQSALKNGIKRMCQIHLAYLGKNPDPSRFEVQFGTISSAEEEELKDALDKGVDIAQKLSDLIVGHLEDSGAKVDKKEILNYVNDKILKLNDFDIDKMTDLVSEAKKKFKSRIILRESGSDCFSYLPNEKICALNESKQVVETRDRKWIPPKVTFEDGQKGAG
jgi:hypothetical protein